MARQRDVLMAQYKQEKTDGKTNATSFKTWNDNRIMTELNATNEEVVNSLTEALEDVQQATTELTKAAKSMVIYEEEDAKALASNLKLVRKNVINRFVTELPISKVGASTYFQNVKRKKGLIATA